MNSGSSNTTDRSVPESEISLGRELRRAREVRGVTVQLIAQETKINERYIHALENDRLDLLPGHPYSANFVRSIARCLGADEEELLDYLNYQMRTAYPEGREAPRVPQRERPRGLAAVVVVGAILVIVILTVALRSGPEADAKPRPGPRPRESVAKIPPPSAALPTAESTGAPPATTAAPDESAPAATAGASAPAPTAAVPPVVAAMARPVATPTDGAQPIAGPTAAAAPGAATAPAPGATGPAGATAAEPAPRVRLVFREKSWVEIQQQGDADPILGIRDPGDEMSWTLDRPLTLKISNAGGVDLFIDGQIAKPLGGPRETRTLVLDRRNWRSYLR